MKKCLFAAAISVGLVVPALAQPQLTVVSMGGANAAAQRKAYYVPFEKTGAKVVAVEYTGEQAKIKAMVEAKKVSWDVVEVRSSDMARGCDEGLFERLDYTKIGNKADYLPVAITDCGMGLFVWSTVMAYDGDRLKDGPKNWADFFDTKKFPGKRGLRKGPRDNLEFALMADGVKPAEVYKLLRTQEGVDRAFRKLSELKSNVQWWEAGAQPPQLLVAGDVVMTSAFNGRIDAANQEGRNLKITWAGSMYDLDYWGIPKGSPNKELALQFISLASRPETQAVYASTIPYGPINTKAIGRLDAAVVSNLPTSPANSAEALHADVQFWEDRGEALEKRFTAWAAQ